jgi:membrane fusion protein (multidrug efflux system)
MKKLISAAIIAAILGTGYFYFINGDPMAQEQNQEQKQTAAAPPPVEVTIYTARTENIVFTRDLPGRTSAFQTAEIRPQVTGIILERLFTEGSLVKKGEQLYQIDPATYQAAYDSAAASLKKAQADLRAVEPKVGRYTELVKMGGVSRQEYDDAVASLAQAQAGVAVAQANLAASKINLDYTKVFSPISGRIGRSSVTEGALVTANQTTALAVVQNLNQIYVDVNQSSQELMDLRKQMKDKTHTPEATLFIGDDSDTYGSKGEILFSDITVDRGTGMVQLRILFPNPEYELLPGLFVRARVEQARQNNAITVPQKSVVRNPDGSVSVWIVDEADTIQSRKITVSKVVGDQWLTESGLAAGDRVVVEGLQKIRPQTKVTPVETNAS